MQNSVFDHPMHKKNLTTSSSLYLILPRPFKHFLVSNQDVILSLSYPCTIEQEREVLPMFWKKKKEKEPLHPLQELSQTHPASALSKLLFLYATLEDVLYEKTLCPTPCHVCCSDYFLITPLEFIAIKTYLLINQSAIFQTAKERALQQLSLLKKNFPEEARRLSKGPSLLTIKQHPLESFLPCPFLKASSCAIYPVRPIICRMHGSCANSPCSVQKKIDSKVGEDDRLPYIDLSDTLQEYITYIPLPTKQDAPFYAFPPIYPLFYWLAREEDYQTLYELANKNTIDDYQRYFMQ